MMPAMEIAAGVGRFDLHGLTPGMIITGFGLLVLLLEIFHRGRGGRAYLGGIAVFGLVLGGMWAYLLWNQRFSWSLFRMMAYQDGFGQAFTAIVVMAAILTCLLATDYLPRHQSDRGEFYALILFAVTGMILVAVAADLVTLFLGIETMSLAVYVLAGFFRHSRHSAEASLKYLILGALSTAIMLYGIALLYGVTKTTHLASIGQLFQESPAICRFNAEGFAVGLQPLPLIGMVMILVSMGFKIALVPFHMWAPDVYDGSPTPAAGFMATAVKVAGFAGLLRLLMIAFVGWPARISSTGWVPILFVLALVTIILGNAAAIVQNKLKRMLAYSSIAHAGYLLLPLIAAGYAGHQAFNGAVPYYLVAYTLATLGAFGVLGYLEKQDQALTYDDLDGLGKRHPWVAASMTIFMISAAGIPPTAGFFAKFLAFKAVIDAAGIGQFGGVYLVVLAALGILASVAGVYYYLRVVVHMYMREQHQQGPSFLLGRAAAVAIALCAFGSVALGILPNRLATLSYISTIEMADTPEGPEAIVPAGMARTTGGGD
ncbi:MAG: NADH-quinone oxidoreductase subunit N [Bradymonadales bacterium]|nr:NADH-quinone oxidoreductase subunit N [Bradymonadales bacterium]